MDQGKYDAELGKKIRRVTEAIVELFYDAKNRMHIATCVGCLEAAKTALITAHITELQHIDDTDDTDDIYGNLPFDLDE